MERFREQIDEGELEDCITKFSILGRISIRDDEVSVWIFKAHECVKAVLYYRDLFESTNRPGMCECEGLYGVAYLFDFSPEF